MALSFLRTGEETAQLGLMLSRLADVLDRDVRNAIQRLISILTRGDHRGDGRNRRDRHRLHHVCYSGLQRFGCRTMTMRKVLRRAESGFTLLELLVVLAIMGMLAAIIAPQVIKYLALRAPAAKVQIQNVMSALELFRLDVGRYPTQQEGLESLVVAPPTAPNWNGPYLRRPARSRIRGASRTSIRSPDSTRSRRLHTRTGQGARGNGRGTGCRELVETLPASRCSRR